MKTKIVVVVIVVGFFAFKGFGIPTTPSHAHRVDVLQQATDADEAAIRQVVQHYFDVTDKKDYDSIKKAFHPEAKLLSVGKNGLNQLTLEQWWARISGPGNIERTMTINSIEIKGVAAVVKVEEARKGQYRSTEFISLLKIDDQWKIVNKILSTKLNI